MDTERLYKALKETRQKYKQLLDGIDQALERIKNDDFHPFKAIEWFDISGRGRVCVGEMPSAMAMFYKVGDLINIDGELYILRGIEMTSSLSNKRVGLFVQKLDEAICNKIYI